jgi:hypothetical protein
MVAAAFLCGGCTRTIPNGVTIERGVVVALYRPCNQAVIGDLKLYEGDATVGAPVWAARLVDPARGTVRMPIVPDVPGYAVTDRRGRGLVPARMYRLDAHSLKGSEWSGATFRPSDLEPGRIKREIGGDRDLPRWERSRTPCVSTAERAWVIVGDVVFVAAVVAGLVALVFVARRRRRSPPALA